MVNLPDVAKVLGFEEAQLLDAIRAFPGDAESLHLMTGIPLACIEAKLAALVALGYVKLSEHGYEIVESRTRPRTRPVNP